MHLLESDATGPQGLARKGQARRASCSQHLPVAVLVTSLFLCLAPLSAQPRLRGFKQDLASQADRLVPLDINGDKKTDLFYYRPGSGYAGVYVSHGDGTFRYVSYSVPGRQSNGFSGDVANAGDRAVVLDFNGDGKDDLLWYRPGSGYASTCLSLGDGQVSCRELSSPDGQSRGFVNDVMDERDTAVALDSNGDGRSDFLWIRPGSGFATLYISQPDGTVKPVEYSRPNQQSNGFQDEVTNGRERVLPLDLNGDGNDDFVWYAPGSGFARAYLSRGDGRVQAILYSRPNQQSNGFTFDVSDTRDTAIALDLNGDGKSDMLWYRPGTGFATAYLSNGDGTLRSITYSTPGSRSNGFVGDVSSNQDTALALDLNGDRKDDFLWYRPGSGYAGVHLSKGDGTLSYVAFSTPSGPTNGFSSDVADQRDTAASASLTGDPGFIVYRPGGRGLAFYALDRANSNAAAYQVTLKPFSYFGDTATWMGDYADLIQKTPIKAIAIPGTHDAAMYPGMPDLDYAKNQRLNFYDQMMAGSRWFDFRFAYINRGPELGQGRFPDDSLAQGVTGNFVGVLPQGFYMYGHSSYIADIAVSEALRQIRTFLLDHPKEIVVISLRASLSGKLGDWTSQAVDVLKTGLGDLAYDKADACKLGGGTWNSTTSRCSAASLLPQDVTPETLWSLGKRAILLDENGTSMTRTSFIWFLGDHEIGAGYQGSTNGIADSDLQLDYMTNDLYTRSATRKFVPPERIDRMLQLNGALTPFGDSTCDTVIGGVFSCLATRITPPVPMAREFNPALSNTIQSDRWRSYALNIVSIDNIGEGDIASSIIEFNNQQWLSDNVTAQDIGVGGDGAVWRVDTDGSIFQRASGEWTKVPGGAARIAVDPKGLPWIVNAQGRIYRYTAARQWELMPGVASDIAIGADGSVWVVGDNAFSSEGGALFQWNNGRWSQLPGNAAGTRIAVDPAGRPWVLNKSGQIFRYNPNAASSWDKIALPCSTDDIGSIRNVFCSTASDIAIGGDGSVWFAGFSSLWRFNGTGWDAFRIHAETVAVGGAGMPWVISSSTNGNQVYRGTVQ